MDERAFLDRFRHRAPAGEARPHPGAYTAPAYPATWERFGAVLTAVGGTFEGAVARGQVAAIVRTAIAARPGRCVASAAAAPFLSDVAGWTRAEDAAARPHGLADVELGVVLAEGAVAENAALLLSAVTTPERALLFLPQHLLVLVPARALVADFITAQAALPKPPPHHLTWMSGPSKTADIEQTLVVGAHGARSLIVVAFAD